LIDFVFNFFFLVQSWGSLIFECKGYYNGAGEKIELYIDGNLNSTVVADVYLFIFNNILFTLITERVLGKLNGCF
jgi:hypothetical protein